MKKRTKILGAIGGTAAALAAGFAGISWTMFSMFLVRHEKNFVKPPTKDEMTPETAEKWHDYEEKETTGKKWQEDHGEICRRVEITNQGLNLVGYYFDQGSKKTIVMVHGLESTHYDVLDNADVFFQHGYNVLGIDLRSHGESDGKYRTMGYWESEDLMCWLQFLMEKEGQEKFILMGESMGAATVMTVAGDPKLPEGVLGIVEDCGFTSTLEIMRHQLEDSFHVKPFPFLNAATFYCEKIGKFKVSEKTPLQRVSQAKVPMLFIHGEEDTFVPYEMLDRLYDSCPSEKYIFRVPGAPHALSCIVAYDQYRHELEEFLRKVDPEIGDTIVAPAVGAEEVGAPGQRETETENHSQAEAPKESDTETPDHSEAEASN